MVEELQPDEFEARVAKVAISALRLGGGMALDELLAVVPPPLTPRNTETLQQWEAVEKMLGTALLSDFRDFCMRYGSGAFNDPGRLIITVRNPLAREFQEQFRTDCESF